MTAPAHCMHTPLVLALSVDEDACVYTGACVYAGANGDPCGQEPLKLTESTGTIDSPGYYNGNYPNNANCQWLIKAPVGNVRHEYAGIINTTDKISQSQVCRVIDGRRQKFPSLSLYSFSGTGISFMHIHRFSVERVPRMTVTSGMVENGDLECVLF